MIILQKENHSAVYTLDYESKELYYAPIYQDNTVNLSEFAPVDLAEYDDEDEIKTIQEQLISASLNVKD